MAVIWAEPWTLNDSGTSGTSSFSMWSEVYNIWFFLPFFFFYFLIFFSVYSLISFRGGYKRQEGKIEVTGVDNKSATKAETLLKSCSFRCIHRIRSGLNEKKETLYNTHNCAHFFLSWAKLSARRRTGLEDTTPGVKFQDQKFQAGRFWRFAAGPAVLWRRLCSRPLKCVKGV